jgi:hypothetical protein
LSDEIEDDLDLNPYKDTRAQALLAHVLRRSPGEASGNGSGSGSGGDKGNGNGGVVMQEESGSVGYALLVSVTRCVVRALRLSLSVVVPLEL